MASNKNQHFVPRCYLKPFGQDEAGKAINLFNLDRARAVQGAPVKGQCSGDYFYGEDLVVERALQAFEGQYASLLKTILAPDYRLLARDRATLAEFWLLQHLRTDAASRRMVEMSQQMDADLGGLPEGYKLEIREAVQFGIKTFFEARGVVADLKVALIRNRSRRAFITSDNPAVMTNRWHLSDPISRGVSPGLLNAGFIGLLPLSPSVLCVIYDGDVYSLANNAGWLDLNDDADANDFNAHQILNCQANLYFKAWETRDEIVALATRVGPDRPPDRHRLEHLVLDRVEGNNRVYRVASLEEANAQQNSIIHSELVLPQPARWPSQMRWRAGGSVYSNGTAIGFVRKATREPGGPAFRKLRLRT